MESPEHNWANFWRVGALDVVLSEYLNKSRNFTNFIFYNVTLRYSIAKIFKLEHRVAVFFENFLPATPTEITFKISSGNLRRS